MKHKSRKQKSLTRTWATDTLQLADAGAWNYVSTLWNVQTLLEDLAAMTNDGFIPQVNKVELRLHSSGDIALVTPLILSVEAGGAIAPADGANSDINIILDNVVGGDFGFDQFRAYLVDVPYADQGHCYRSVKIDITGQIQTFVNKAFQGLTGADQICFLAVLAQFATSTGERSIATKAFLTVDYVLKQRSYSF